MPDVIDLSTLTPEQGFFIQGDAALDGAGNSVASAGDLNGDGFVDLIIGAPYGDNGGTDAGEAYVIFGHAGGFANIDLTTLTSDQGFVIQGDAAGDKASRSVASAGDVNGDGFADLIVGAPFGDDGGTDAGEAYVIFGHAGRFGNIDLGSLAPKRGFIIRGDAARDRAGFSVSSAGDVNGDGFADLIVGAPLGDDAGHNLGEAYVIFGHAGGFADIDLTTLASGQGFVIQGDRELKWTGSILRNWAGISVASADDINGDGFDDLIVVTRETGAYVIFGHAGGFANIDLETLAPEQGFNVRRAGQLSSASSAGDVNADGFADLIFGAPDAYYDGEVYVVFGHAGGFANLDLRTLARGEQGFRIRLDMPGGGSDDAGRSVSSAGDVNGDGFADLIFGASGGDFRGSPGEAYVIFGRRGGFSNIDLATLTPEQGFVIQGDQGGTGNSVSSAGDVNNDGFADLVVGASSSDNGGFNAGEAYVIYGQAPTEAVNRAGTEIANTILGGAFDDTLHGLGGNDTLEGGAGNDLLRGGAGIDTVSYAHAAAGVSVRLNRALQDAGDTFNSIENLTGSAFIDVLIGSRWANTLAGLGGGDFLHGGESRDTLLGGEGGDMLDGGAHKDTLTGGVGHDRFRFDDGDLGTARALADVVTDFSQAEGDILRLNLVDADAATAGDQVFAWLGDGAFTGAAGQLHYVHQSGNTFVEGDLDGDGVADVFINLTGTIDLTVADFVL